MSQKYLRITLKGAPVTWFDVPVPENANMGGFSAALQSAGYLVFDRAWIPREEIKHMSIIEVNGTGTVHEFPRPVA